MKSLLHIQLLTCGVFRHISLFSLALAAFAQTDSASLSGRITDPSGAAVAGAAVSLTNLATGATRATTATGEGRYQFNLLPPGAYQVKVEAPGFKTFVDGKVAVQVALPAILDVSLTLGATSETVEVFGTASLLNTESASSGAVISQEKILSLPLNGRQFIQLALLAPGANAGGRQVQQNNVRLNQTGGFSSSGGRTNNNLFLFDGAANTDPDYNALSYVPIVDSLAEFQVQSAQYGAQYGRASGSQVNVVSRSGSNQFHGSAWEFLRNQRLDARPFNSVTSRLPKNQRHQFGAVLGGPIVKNKLFFFGAWERLTLRQAGVGITNVIVPTAAERQGNFSASPGAFFDPDTLVNGVRSPFPNNIIPANRINPITRAAIDAMPLPNVGAQGFVNGNAILRQDGHNGSLRLDHNLTARANLFFRYSISDEQSIIPDVVPLRERLGFVRPQNVALGWNQTLSANAVNELRLGFNRLRFQDGLPEPLFNVGGRQTIIPRFRPAGYPVMGGAGAFTGTTGGGTVLVRNNTYQIYDNFSWFRGRHNLKFGGEWLRLDYNRSEAASPLGDFQFLQGYTSRTASNDGTGNALATMLLGLPNQGNRQVVPTRLDARQNSFALYLQDDIRLHARLSLNLGLRYELAEPLWDRRGQMASIDFSKVPWPTQIFAKGRLNFYRPTLFTCGLGGYPKGCAFTDKNNFAPRLGLSFRAMEKTVVRAGAGIFYANTDFNGLLQLARGLPTNISQNLNAPSNFVPSFRGFDIFGSATEVGRIAVSQASIDLYQRTSYSPQISFSIQRELSSSTLVEASYLGTFGIRLQQNVQPNNAMPGSGAVDPRRPYAGLLFDTAMVFPSYVNVVSPFVPATQVNFYAHSAQSNYHALLLRFERRYARGFSWLSSYTFSKAITNAPQFRNAGGANGSENSPPQNSYDLRAERGLASFDLRHRWVNTIVYDLPFGKNARYFQSGLAAHLLGGWQISGINQLQTGFPFTINLNGDTAGIGGGTGGILIRPNAVPGATYRLPAEQRSTERFFNTAAFALTPAFQFGNVGRNTVIGPGLFNTDLTVARRFALRESIQLQFRAELFNLLNTPNHNIVGRLINVPATFGRVLNQLDPRQIQFAAKLSF
jgi:hypothetical protein